MSTKRGLPEEEEQDTQHRGCDSPPTASQSSHNPSSTLLGRLAASLSKETSTTQPMASSVPEAETTAPPTKKRKKKSKSLLLRNSLRSEVHHYLKRNPEVLEEPSEDLQQETSPESSSSPVRPSTSRQFVFTSPLVNGRRVVETSTPSPKCPSDQEEPAEETTAV